MKLLKERTFKVDIVIAFCALLFLTVLLITGFVYFRSRSSVLELVRERFSNRAAAVIRKTSDYMTAAQVLAELSTSIFEDPSPELGLDTKLAAYFLAVVLNQKEIDLFYYGNEQGDFLQAARFGDVTYTKFIHRTPDSAVTSFRYLNEARELEREETLIDDPYDPRERPWYQGAKETGQSYWTEPYIFHESGKPGITVACPVYGSDSELKGVVAADITLNELSAFLSNLVDGSEHGISFILDAEGQLVAYPEPDRMVAVDQGAVRNLRPQELKISRVTQAMRVYEDTQADLFSYSADGERHIACFTPFPDAFGKQWTFAVLAPENDFLGPLKDTLKATYLGSAVLLLLAVAAGFFLARQISRPIEHLTDEVLGVKDFNLETTHTIRSHIQEVQTMNSAIEAMKRSLKAFKLYVPATLVRQLVASGEEISIGGKDRELTLFFSDIADFTSHSESMAPKDLMVQLSEYFDRVSQIIDCEKGTLDKFIGDSVMAFWGAPVVNDEHAVLACRAALKCRDAVDTLNEEWLAAGKPAFETRIGIHTGYVTVGNIGSPQRMNYSVIGDNVNLASRLEGVNKVYGTKIIISQGTHRYVQSRFVCRILDQIAVKGKTQSVAIYELLAEIGTDEAQRLRAFSDSFNNAYRLYLERNWTGARGILKDLLEDHPGDEIVSLYIERCERYMGKEPDEDWTGITRLSQK